jgi:peptidoglycan hydrolase FlgJ
MTTPIQSLNASVAPDLSAAASSSAGSNYTDLNGLAALKNSPNSPAAIHAVAQQVEALFLQMMLKSMRDASAADGEPDSNETGMYQDMFDKQVALTLSKHQDLGLTRLFERQLGGKASDTHAAAAPAPGTHSGLPKIGLSAPETPADGRRGGAGSSDSVTAHHATQFVSAVLPTIRRVAQGLGVNPLGLLAQAALETGWGRRMAHTADGSPSLNLFGIKAGESWNGSRAVADTVEFSGGVATQRRTAFRAYGSIEESVNDFANLLSNSPRYRDAVAAGNDAQAYIHSIARSGYASDPEYGNKLNKILNSDTLRAALGVKATSL